MLFSFEGLNGVRVIRLTGILLIGFSIVEFAIGAAAYGFLLKDNVGGWWGAIPTLILGFMSQYCNSRGSLWTIHCFAVLAGIIVIAALSLDGQRAFSILQSGCYSTSNEDETYGRQSHVPDAYNCSYIASADCVCSTGNSMCSSYSLTLTNNCQSLFSVYYNELVTSAVINSVLCLLCIFQAGFCPLYLRFGPAETVEAIFASPPDSPDPFNFEYLKGIQEYSLQIRLTGYLLIGVSIIEFAVGLAAFGFLSRDHVGGWWAAVFTLLVGAWSQFCNSRWSIRGILWLSVVAGIICIAAVTDDGGHANTILDSGCYATSNVDETYGKQSLVADAYNCPYVTAADCICSSYPYCYAYFLTLGSSCESLFSTYYRELVASTAINATLSLLCIIQLILCVWNLLRPDAAQRNVSPLPPAPHANSLNIPSPVVVIPDTVLYNGIPTSYATVATALGTQHGGPSYMSVPSNTTMEAMAVAVYYEPPTCQVSVVDPSQTTWVAVPARADHNLLPHDAANDKGQAA